MTIRKLSSTNAFVAIDLAGAARSAGVVRSAPKILQGGATDLARSLTYQYAAYGLEVGGLSAGINAEPDDRPEAVAAFVAELADDVAAGTLAFDPAKGVDAADLAALDAVDPRSSRRREPVDGISLDAELTGRGAAAAAEAALGAFDGRTFALDTFNDVAVAAACEAIARGGRLVAVGTWQGRVDVADTTPDAVLAAWTSSGPGGAAGLGTPVDDPVYAVEADVVFTGAKVGAIDHTVADTMATKAVVPVAALPVTAKAFAHLRRTGTVVVPDFVSLGGGLVAWDAGEASVDELRSEATASVVGVLEPLLDHPEGPYLGACYAAEEFLRTWRDELPFGRPFAA